MTKGSKGGVRLIGSNKVCPMAMCSSSSISTHVATVHEYTEVIYYTKGSNYISYMYNEGFTILQGAASDQQPDY